ncbi:hypothetical protein RFF05_06945 [Bengtsoniella intestinalis]|uniref:hypothetical protein n=1 Tax=Bengtsoniella intestinalis TaxID=3073143 RepID=UPI00391F406F
MTMWKIRNSAHGGYVAELGFCVESTPCGFKPGNYMPAFIRSESYSFDTLAKARRYVQRKQKESACYNHPVVEEFYNV